MPIIGSLRLWHRAIWKYEPFYVAVKDVAEAVQTALLLLAYCRYLNPREPDSVCGLEEWTGEEWIAYRDEDGKGFSDYMGQDAADGSVG